MPSPFPGMDPWLEESQIFPSLHEKLAVYLSEELNSRMPDGYIATIKNRVWIGEHHVREPDVSLLGPGNRNDTGAVATLPGLTTVEDELDSDPIEEPYLEIVTANGRRLVTAIEIISLTNKESGEKGRKSYQRKQREYHRAGVNLVEIDLLRGGPHVTAVSLHALRRAVGPFDYHICVRAEHPRSRFFAAGIALSDRLPEIGIPLSHDVPPVTIDLQPMIDRAYDTGRYASLVDYSVWCTPPLRPDRRAWAEAILREKGLLK